MRKRPFRVTLSLWLVLFLTAWNGLRLWSAIAWRNVLIEFSARPTPIISGFAGAFWLVAGIVLVWSILWEKEWAGKMLLGAATGYTVWYWTERLAWQEPRSNWPFAVTMNLLLLIFIIFTTRSLTREAYEREHKKSTFE